MSYLVFLQMIPAIMSETDCISCGCFTITIIECEGAALGNIQLALASVSKTPALMFLSSSKSLDLSLNETDRIFYYRL